MRAENGDGGYSGFTFRTEIDLRRGYRTRYEPRSIRRTIVASCVKVCSMTSRFVQPEIVRLSLSNGDFLDVKRELNAGEHRGVFADMVKGGVVKQGEIPELDLRKVGITRAL